MMRTLGILLVVVAVADIVVVDIVGIVVGDDIDIVGVVMLLVMKNKSSFH